MRLFSVVLPARSVRMWHAFMVKEVKTTLEKRSLDSTRMLDLILGWFL